MSRRAYAGLVAIAVVVTLFGVGAALARAGSGAASPDRWGTERLVESSDTSVVRTTRLRAAASNAEVRRRRLDALPAVGVEVVDGGFRLGWEEPADCRARQVTLNETPTEVLVEVEAREPFANDEGTGCAQRGPRGDDVAGTLPVRVTTVVLEAPLGDRPVRDAARNRPLERVNR